MAKKTLVDGVEAPPEPASDSPPSQVKIGLAKYLGMGTISDVVATVLRCRYRMETHTESEWDGLAVYETSRRIVP